MAQKITASFIIELLGRPPEHIKKALEQLIEKLGTEKGVKITESYVHEPKKLEQEKVDEKKLKEAEKKLKGKNITVTSEIFTTFAEIEAEFETLESLLFITFNYMPSNIEIISPENFILRNTDIGGLLTGIIIRLHRYDEIAKKLVIDKSMLENQLKEILKINKNKGGIP